MQLRKSYFNKTLFRKNLSRSWPLWGAVTAGGCLVVLYMLLSLMSYRGTALTQNDFSSALYNIVTSFVPGFTLCYAVLAAMLVWGYLCTPRAVGMMHTLPVDRTTLFVTGTASGFAMLLLPYAITGGFAGLIALGWGIFDLKAMLVAVAAVILMTALFFGMATLCAMVSGHAAAMPVFYFVLNFLAAAADWLLSSLSSEMLVGVRMEYSGAVEFLSPVLQIYNSFHYRGLYDAAGERYYALEGLGVVALYGLVGVALLAAALLLYRRRASECAGDVVAFRQMRPLFRVAVGMVSALTLGRVFYALLWAEIFQSGNYADVWPMAICAAAAGGIGYLAASMVLEKNLRLSGTCGRGAAAVCAAAGLLCLCLGMDIFGVERRVPELESIGSVELYVSGYGDSMQLDAESDRHLVAAVRQLHEMIAENVDEIRAERDGYIVAVSDKTEIRERVYEHIRIDYTLKDGREVRRLYNLYLDRTDWESGIGFEGALRQLLNTDEIRLRAVSVPMEAQFAGMEVYCYRNNRSSYDEGYQVNERALYDALLQDAREGNLMVYDPFDPAYDENLPVTLEIEFRVAGEAAWEWSETRWATVHLEPTMQHTMDALLADGFITEEDLAVWVSELKYPGGKKLP